MGLPGWAAKRTVPAGLVQPFPRFFLVRQQLDRKCPQRLVPQPLKVGLVDLA